MFNCGDIMKKFVFAMAALCVFLLCGCRNSIRNEKIVRGTARGNVHENVNAVQLISELETVKTVSVLHRKDTVLAGIRMSETKRTKETCEKALQILKMQFPDAANYIVSADEQWAEDVIELGFYAEGGMNRGILEKRFEYLAWEKMGEK